ncbi:hypothetical protein DQG23_07290 [Paenibacillus contaminans]|uniref:Uncharacterized protein n=1 Tax=Paenibacillus contaminans TaxID=450362 RepID=A0A329MT39_9BACL|nr:hypothetical protein DQG23_07290 [Paenibacillus contaminans]
MEYFTGKKESLFVELFARGQALFLRISPLFVRFPGKRGGPLTHAYEVDFFESVDGETYYLC